MFQKKLTRFLAASVIALFLGATWAHAQVVIVDTDLDGIDDANDECVPSDLSSTVLIDSVDTGIPNTAPNGVGCTLADLLQDIVDLCLDKAPPHGKFVSCVSHETNILKRAKTISGKVKGKFQSFVAKMK